MLLPFKGISTIVCWFTEYSLCVYHNGFGKNHLVTLSVLRLGQFKKLTSYSVIAGFMAGLGLLAYAGIGISVAVVDNVRTNALNGAVPAGVSSSGLLVYLPGENTGAAMSLILATRNGPGQVLLDQRLLSPNLSLSPDGGRLALMINDGRTRSAT